MSRRLQMLVEEGEHSSCVHAVRTVGKSKPATVFCRNERQEAKPATVFCRNRPREAKPATVFCRNERREAKPATVFIKKRKKLRIPWTESSEIAENCKFCGRNHQKTENTADSVGRIIRNR